MKFWVIFSVLILMLLQLNSFAVEEEMNGARRFDNSTLEELSKSDSFYYLEMEESDPSTAYAITEWIQNMLKFVFGNKIAYAIFSNLHLIILFVALVLIALKITQISPAKIFYKSKDITLDNFSIDEQTIDLIDFSELIASALQKKNYRLALRYHYLELLKTLSEKELIDWNPHKTNYEILSELKDMPFRDKFRSLALVFEYVWYGEFEISETGFMEVRNDFLQLKKQIA